MNDLLTKMSDDLSIPPYGGESATHYAFRICYSALANWIIYLTQSKNGAAVGISKSTQTAIVENLLHKYSNYFHLESRMFPVDGSDLNRFSHHIRRVYEETGYLFSDQQNNSISANFMRTIATDDGFLYFGIPESPSWTNGLGIYCTKPGNEADLFDVMLRDTLTVQEFLAGKYNWLDFDEYDFEPQSMSYFNPFLRSSPSKSWESSLTAKFSLARDSSRNLYRTMYTPEGMLVFAEEPISPDNGKLYSSEYRRLYIALKAWHDSPVIAWINSIDDIYSSIHISAHLPNREYYFMLLFGWPERDAYDRTHFICKNRLISIIERMLTNIGIEIRR